MRNKLASITLGVVGAVLVIGSLYFGITYVSYLGKAMIDFLAANDLQTLNSCGIVVPPAFIQMSEEFPSILPVLYLGIPVLLAVISLVMFGSGYYYGKHNMGMDEESKKEREEHIQREVEKRTGAKPATEAEKTARKAGDKAPEKSSR